MGKANASKFVHSAQKSLAAGEIWVGMYACKIKEGRERVRFFSENKNERNMKNKIRRRFKKVRTDVDATSLKRENERKNCNVKKEKIRSKNWKQLRKKEEIWRKKGRIKMEEIKKKNKE